MAFDVSPALHSEFVTTFGKKSLQIFWILQVKISKDIIYALSNQVPDTSLLLSSNYFR